MARDHCDSDPPIQTLIRRRRFLGAAGAGIAAATAGCSGGGGDGGGETDGEVDDAESGGDSSTADSDGDNGDDGGSNTGESGGDGSNADESDGDESDGGADGGDVEAIETQSFSGSGDATRSGVSIEGGPTVLEITYTGGSDFSADLRNDEAHVPFIDRRDDFAGDVGDVVPTGEFDLEIIATGDWEVDVVQPRAGQGESLPVSFDRSGADVVGPVQFSGTNTATIEYAGTDTFIMGYLEMSNDGTQVSGEEVPILVQGTESFSVERTFSSDDVGWLLTRGTGEWSVTVE